MKREKWTTTPSSRSWITRGTSPTRFGKYRLPRRPARCSESSASPHGSETRLTSPKTLRLPLLLRRALGSSTVDPGELAHELLVVLARFCPGGEIRFPGLGDGVHPPG